MAWKLRLRASMVRACSCVALLAWAVSIAACGGSVDEAAEDVGEARAPISGGYDDDGDHAVVGIAMLDATGHVFRTCSGTLISENLVLTAQHCIAETATFVDCATSSFGPPMAPARVRITTAPSMWETALVWHTALDVRVPPGPPIVCGRDIALLILRERVADDEAEPMPPQLDRGVEEQEIYAAIGYGTSSEQAADSGIRRRRDALVVACVGPTCGSTSHVDGREWRGDQGICNGDSGGPALDGNGTLIGVTSRGPLGCADPIYGGLTAYKDWIRETGRDAATVGKYDTPWWVDHDTSGGPISKEELSHDAWRGCSTSPTGGPARSAASFLVALACALRLRRLRAGKRRESGRS